MLRSLRTVRAALAAAATSVLMIASGAQADTARHADRRHDVQRFTDSVPRCCLDSPRWARVGAAVATFSPDVLHNRFDDAYGGRRADDDHLVLCRQLLRG